MYNLRHYPHHDSGQFGLRSPFVKENILALGRWVEFDSPYRRALHSRCPPLSASIRIGETIPAYGTDGDRLTMPAWYSLSPHMRTSLSSPGWRLRPASRFGMFYDMRPRTAAPLAPNRSLLCCRQLADWCMLWKCTGLTDNIFEFPDHDRSLLHSMLVLSFPALLLHDRPLV